ncbi:MAG: FKBP-type peptidyl-prolyl cis-trans isomerase [Thermoplasmatota archaeon]
MNAAVEAAKDGDTVHIHYTGKLDDGEVFDSSDGREPLEFTLGEGEVIPGFEKAVRGLKVGESRTVRIPPEEAYGNRETEAILKLDRKMFRGQNVAVGQHLDLEDDAGNTVHADVVAVDATSVTVDTNHHLAGQALTFTIKLVKIE